MSFETPTPRSDEGKITVCIHGGPMMDLVPYEVAQALERELAQATRSKKQNKFWFKAMQIARKL